MSAACSRSGPGSTGPAGVTKCVTTDGHHMTLDHMLHGNSSRRERAVRVDCTARPGSTPPHAMVSAGF